MLNFKLFNSDTICPLYTAQILSFITWRSSLHSSTAVRPSMDACAYSIINLKLQIIVWWPSSNISNIKSDDQFKMLFRNPSKIFRKIIWIHILSSKWNVTACENVLIWRWKSIKRQTTWTLKISEEYSSLIFRNTGIVRIGKVFIFKDCICTDVAAVLSNIKTSASERDTVRMTEERSCSRY